MNERDEDQAFDEYLNRGSRLSSRYRELEMDEVPAEVDARVLADAQRAVRAKPGAAARWRRWAPPVAIAASAVLAISVVLDGSVQREAAMVAPAQDASAPAAEQVQADSIAPAEAPVAAAAEVHESKASAQSGAAEPALEARAPKAAEPQSVAPAPAMDARVFESPQAEVSSLPSPREPEAVLSVTQSRAAELEKRSAARREAQGQRVLADEAYAAPDEEDVDPAAWLERIRKLREAGDHERANVEWRKFLERFPHHEVAPDDLARPAADR